MTLSLPPEPVPLPPEQVPADSPLSGLATIAHEHDPSAAPGMLPAGKPRSAFRRSLDVFLENKLAVTGVAIFVAMLLFCFAGPLVYHTDQVHVNLANANGVDRLITAPATRLIQDSNGVVFAVSKTAQDLFDHRNPDDSIAADNVFAAVNNLRVALEWCPVLRQMRDGVAAKGIDHRRQRGGREISRKLTGYEISD